MEGFNRGDARFAEFPDLKDIAKPKQAVEVCGLLARMEAIQGMMDELKAEAEDLNKALEVWQKQLGQPGLRSGKLAFVVSDVAGRRSLDRELLIENGVSASVIAASMKAGKPSVRREFRVIGKEQSAE